MSFKPIKNKNSEYQLFNFVFSFGMTLALTLYLTYQGGTWLDRRFNTEPGFMLILVSLGVVATLRVLLKDLMNEYGKSQDQ
jgi:F0F1-type ATP synthase assembly protein I